MVNNSTNVNTYMQLDKMSKGNLTKNERDLVCSELEYNFRSTCYSHCVTHVTNPMTSHNQWLVINENRYLFVCSNAYDKYRHCWFWISY